MRGAILCNGNARSEGELIHMVRPWLTSSRHRDEEVQRSGKVLLITAAWQDHEYEESHIKAALADIGIPSHYVDGFDTNIQNLGAWHAYREFCHQERTLADPWEARERLMEATRHLYLEKNAFYTALLRRTVQTLQATDPGCSLASLVRDLTRHLAHAPASFDGHRLFGHLLANDIKDTVEQLISNDDRMMEVLQGLEDHFVAATGLYYDPAWQRLRRVLEERILSSNAIMIFGGTLNVLHRCLSFFRLAEVLHEALRRGTTFYSVSAGSLLLCERIIVYNDFATDLLPRSEFQLFGRGFGLVQHLQIFPHCMDRIQTDDPDNLAYLAWRFQNRTCVGLNEDSLLLVEANPTLQCTSVGQADGVYVFDMEGNKRRFDQGEVIPVQ